MPADRWIRQCLPMIVLFTDFGLAGPYTGQVKAVLASDAPDIPVIDLFSDAPTRDPRAAAYLLAAYGAWFPPGTVFVAVVDPGVGGSRKPIVVEADERNYIGPDNGLFELVIRRAKQCRGWEITWQPPALSASFHGRDLFAPVAARLARGDETTGLARETSPARFADWPDDLAEIIYIGGFGNAMTGLRAGMVPSNASLIAGHRIIRHGRTYSAVPSHHAFWYENSNGLVEIAVNGGRADAELALAIGSRVAVESHRARNAAAIPAAGRNREKPRPKPHSKPPGTTGNPRLAEQTRKVLGKHYANKYRVK
ncbi:MAG: SAM hydrolase/SAM-dependent halogenase family protein [Dongiaceae bacterium]